MSPGGHWLSYCTGTISSLLSHCNVFEERIHIDEIYGCLIFMLAAVTWLGTSVKVFRLQKQFSFSQIQLEAFNGSFAIRPSFEISLKMSQTLKDTIFVQRWKFKSSQIYELIWIFETPSGGRLNIKMSSYQYRDSHVKDKTVSPTVLSLTWESPYLGKMVFILRRGPGHLSADCGNAIADTLGLPQSFSHPLIQ